MRVRFSKVKGLMIDTLSLFLYMKKDKGSIATTPLNRDNILWHAINSKLPKMLTHAVIHCGTINIDLDLPLNITNRIMAIGLALQEKCPELKMMLLA